MKSIWFDDFPRTKNPLRFLWYVSKPHRTPMAIALVAVTIASTMTASIAYIFKLIANAAANLPITHSYSELLWASGAYILVRFVSEMIWRLSGFAGGVWANGVRATARNALLGYVTLHSRSYFSDRFAGSISNKIGHAANGTRDMIEQILWQFLQFVVSIIAGFIIAFMTNPLIAYIFLLWVAIAAFINTFFARKRIPLSAEVQTIETTLNGATVDLLSNITTMQEYARRFFEMNRLRDMIEHRRRIGIRNWFYGERILVFNGFLQAIFSAAMVFIAIYLTSRGSVSVGDIILVITLIFNIEGQMLFLGAHLNNFGERWGEITESLDEIYEPHEIPNHPDAKELVVSHDAISLDKVSFSYGDKIIFDALSMHIPSGERVGLVGRSGAGKSTLMRILLHHHDIQSGMVAIDGIDITTVTQESLRSAMSIVPQESILFHRTIRENIAYGKPDAAEHEIKAATYLAQAGEFIERLPHKYESMVGERGVKLSGGERQRIAIARAILKNSPILLLDEATSALDSQSEVAIQKALHMLMEGKTVIAIAHRLSTLREMDRIIVLERGKIVEEGKHEDLIRGSGVYAELWKHQAGGFLQDE